MITAQRLIKNSGLYFTFKILISKSSYRSYFRKIEEVNKSNVIQDKGVIIAPNHQNALLDPMAFATHLPGRNIFLARADAFKKPLALALLNQFKMLPVYRIRDGIESLKKNEEVFETCVDVLNLNSRLAMFPEGNHGPKRMIRPLVKGVFRIAFKAQSTYGKNPGIKIIPAGVEYNDYYKFRQNLLIIYGEPIEVSEYWEEFEKNPVIATNQLKERLSKEMQKVAIHIETDEYYETYLGLRGIYNKTLREKLNIKEKSLHAKFKADKILIEKLDNTLESEPQKIEELSKEYNTYSKIRKKLNLRDWVFNKDRYSIITNAVNLLLCALVSPMFLLGLINNWPHFFIPKKMAKSVKDKQFTSTVQWGVGTLIFAAYYLIVGILVLIFLPEWWLKLAYILSMPASGILALTIRKICIKSRSRIRYTLKHKSQDLRTAKETREKIIGILDEITN